MPDLVFSFTGEYMHSTELTNRGQTEEIGKNFNPDLYWFDGDWEQSAEKWKAKEIRKMILDRNPSAIIKEYLKPYWSNNSGLTFIDVPEKVQDEYLTVIAVILDGKLKIQYE